MATVADERCRCVHFRASHPDDGSCRRTLAAVDEPGLQLPEWRCPCEGFRPDGGRLGGYEPGELAQPGTYGPEVFDRG